MRIFRFIDLIFFKTLNLTFCQISSKTTTESSVFLFSAIHFVSATAENCRFLKFNVSDLQKDQKINAKKHTLAENRQKLPKITYRINALITGTAKQFVTHDYGEKMFDGMIATRNLMKISSQYLLMKVSPLIFV